MTTIIIILFILSIFHFIYESIVLPNGRLRMRYELFALRDQLINLKIDQNETIDNEVFIILEDTISTIIKGLPYFSISRLWKGTKQFDSDRKFKKYIEEKREIIESCKNDTVREINDKALYVAQKAFLSNSGGWLSIIVPFWILYILIDAVTDSLKSISNYFKRKMNNITYASGRENDFDKSQGHLA